MPGALCEGHKLRPGGRQGLDYTRQWSSSWTLECTPREMGSHWRGLSREDTMTRSVFSKDHCRNCPMGGAPQVFGRLASVLNLLSELNSTCPLHLGEGCWGAAWEKGEGREWARLPGLYPILQTLLWGERPHGQVQMDNLSVLCFPVMESFTNSRHGCQYVKSGWPAVQCRQTLVHLGCSDTDS